MHLMDVEVPHKVDGRDASALFLGKDVDWDDIIFVRATSEGSWISAISEEYKLVYSANEEPWLFDLKNDPNELTNLAGSAEYADMLKAMTEKLVAYGKEYKDPHLDHPRVQSWIKQVLEK